jgi:hypothetical protein
MLPALRNAEQLPTKHQDVDESKRKGAALFGHALAAINRQILAYYSFAAIGMGCLRAR